MKRRDFLKGAIASGLPVVAHAEGAETQCWVPADILFPLGDLNVRFDMDELKKQVRGHEGVVLQPYADPQHKTANIGMGFSLNVEETRHGGAGDPYQYNGIVRRDPSSEALWSAAGVKTPYADIMKVISFNKGIVNVASPAPGITAEDAENLLDISIRQATYNAAGYFRHFKEMTAPQQMAVSEIVYQLGTHLEQFGASLVAANDAKQKTFPWQQAQQNFHKSEWREKYPLRANRVIAMLDPDFGKPKPVAKMHKGKHTKSLVRSVSFSPGEHGR